MMGVIFIKIKKAIIYGFGKWVDYTIDFQAASLLCIYGENESGKTTLQQFILFILFGLPPKQRQFFRPKTSGKMGGRLIITDAQNGDYVIERMDEVSNGAAICYTSDGNKQDETWLRKQLDSMTTEVYRSIFTFSALDLKDLHLMKDDDLGEVILGIGLTGSRNIADLERRLDYKIGELFKPTGKVPIINKQLDHLDTQFNKLTHFKNNEATYSKKQTELSDLKNNLKQVKSDLHIEKERQLTLERMLNNILTINDYHTYHQQLNMYPSEITFPEEGLTRFNKIKEKLLPLKSEWSILKSSIEKSKTEQIILSEKIVSQDVYEEAQNILKETEQYRLNEMAYTKQQKQQKDITAQINEKLSELNIDITSDEVGELSFPFYLEKLWNDLKSKMEKQKATKEQLNHEKNTLNKQHDLLNQQKENLSNKQLTSKEITTLYNQIDLYKEQNYLQKRQQNVSDQHVHWEKLKNKKHKNMNLILISSLLLSLLLGIAGLVVDEMVLYLLTCLILTIGIGQYLRGKREIKETSALLASESKIAKDLTLITEEEKNLAEQRLQHDDENRYMLASINNQLKSLNVELIKWTEKYNRLIQLEKSLQEQIEEQKYLYPFLRHIDLMYWPELYQSLKKIIDLDRNKTIINEEIKVLSKQLNEFAGKIERFLEVEMKDQFSDHLKLQISKIKEMVEIQQTNYYALEQSKETENDLIEELNKIEERIKIYEQEMAHLYVLAQVDDENAYYARAKQVEKRKVIAEDMIKSLKQIQLIFSESEQDKLTKIRPNQSQLEVECEETINKIKELDQQIDTIRHQITELKIELNQMESSESYSHAVHTFSWEKEKLTKLADEWAKLKIAKEMLAATKRHYRDNYLNKVISKTSAYFKQITGNRYTQVLAPQDKKPFQVETEDQMRYDVNELSQGTVDQLYICLRIAISEVMSDKHHIPFIIDDAFVHFDGLRTERMLNILSSISKKQQVIYFTCKKDTLQWLSDSNLIYLPDAK